MNIVHHHLIYQAEVTNQSLGANSEKELRKLLYDLLTEINMACLIPAQLKFSRQKAWTGIIGIVTSHISFHYWTIEKYVQLDIYSCKPFNKRKAIKFLNNFWQAKNVQAIFINRKTGQEFKIEKI